MASQPTPPKRTPPEVRPKGLVTIGFSNKALLNPYFWVD